MNRVAMMSPMRGQSGRSNRSIIGTPRGIRTSLRHHKVKFLWGGDDLRKLLRNLGKRNRPDQPQPDAQVTALTVLKLAASSSDSARSLTRKTSLPKLSSTSSRHSELPVSPAQCP